MQLCKVAFAKNHWLSNVADADFSSAGAKGRAGPTQESLTIFSRIFTDKNSFIEILR
jgi:hypothetical protein